MAFEIDDDKAQTFFLRCILSSRKFQEREVSRKKLVGHLEKLRNVKINKAFQHHLDELDKKLADLLEKERAILSSQRAEHGLHGRLNNKIKDLENKLTGYLEFKKTKMIRIKELEDRIKKRFEEKDRVAKLQGEIEGLEMVFTSLQQSGSFPPAKLKPIKNKINQLKEQIKEK